MATTLKFRPVMLGSPARPTEVFHLIEGRDGGTWLRDFDGACPIEPPLEAVTVDDFPPNYRSGRVQMTILPVQQVSAPTEAEAFERMLDVLREIRTEGVPQARSA